jgi:hypothetical protein
VTKRQLSARSKIRTFTVLAMVVSMAQAANAYDRFGILHNDPRLSARLLACGSMLGMAEGAEAVMANPAGLGTLNLSEVYLNTALFSDPSVGETLVYAQPLASLGKIGLGLSVLSPLDTSAEKQLTAEIPAQEQIMAMVYTATWYSVFDVGFRYRMIKLEQSGSTPVSGQTMDVGARWRWEETMWLSVGAYNIFQPVAALPGLDEATYPRFTQATIGVYWPEVMQAGLEYSRAWDGTNIQRVAFGLESDFSKHWFIRAGIDPQAISAGIGFSSHEWSIDYGWRSDSAESKMQHRLNLAYRFGAYQAHLESSTPFLTKGGLKPNVLFKVQLNQRVILKNWVFKVVDSNDNLVYTQQGKHALEVSMLWEGRDQKSRMVPDGDYTAFLEGVDFEGNALRSNRVHIQVSSYTKPEFQLLK